MGILIFLSLVIIVLAVAQKLFAGNQKGPAATAKIPVYQYGRKDYIMTKAEHNFFLMLSQTFQGKYHVFPQVHLSSILDEKMVKGQNWNAAFKHINGKSVDFVICDKRYAKPLVAVELDDWSHSSQNRRTRDEEVERIFAASGMPLVRFADYKNLSLADIEDKLRSAVES
jgi:very-short-patch-repair endonuclease